LKINEQSDLDHLLPVVIAEHGLVVGHKKSNRWFHLCWSNTIFFTWL